MIRSLEVLFTPAEFNALRERDLTASTCVVFDILRATSVMLAALAAGAEAIIPVSEIGEALDVKRAHPAVLLGGERDGVRITSALTDGTDFDLGNSPREYTSERVAGKVIVSTTTNGTRALRACMGAREVLAAAFLNLTATAEWLVKHDAKDLILVCSGSHERAAYEDVLAAGALCDALASRGDTEGFADSTHIARQVYLTEQSDLLGAMRHSWNARRLLSLPELRDDVAFCLRRDAFNFTANLNAAGRVVLNR